MPRFANALIVPEISTPATPSAGSHALYFKSDGKAYQKDPSGTESLVVSGITDSMVSPVTPNTVTGTTYTFVLADASRIVLFTSATAVAASLPLNSTTAFPVGCTLQWVAMGAGQVTVSGVTGTTVHAPHGAKTNVQYSRVNATKVGTDEWLVDGDTTT